MPRAPETLVDVLFAAVLQGEFTQEPLPFGAPFRIIRQPLRCAIRSFDLRKGAGKIEQFPAAVELRAHGRPAYYLPPHMDETALYRGVGPYRLRRFLEARSAIGDHHGRRRHLGHEGRPGCRALALGQMPCHNMPFGAGDKHTSRLEI